MRKALKSVTKRASTHLFLSKWPAEQIFVVMTRMVQSAKVGWLEKLCYGCGSFNIQLINLVDFLTGCMFLIFGAYMYSKFDGGAANHQSAWIIWCSLILGILLIITVFFSFCAITNKGCRCCMSFSKHLAVLLAGLDFGAGISAIVLQKRFYSYLDDHGSEEGITDSDISDIKRWYLVIACMMLGSCVLEIVRFLLSRGFTESSQRIDGEFDALIEADDAEWRAAMETNNAARTEKYRDLRAQYKQKYANYARTSADSASIL